MDDIFSLVINRIQTYLEKDMNISVLKYDNIPKNNMILKKDTIVISVSTNDFYIISICYDKTLLKKLISIFLDGEVLLENEEKVMHESIALEISNIIVGNALSNVFIDSIVSISPPLYIHRLQIIENYQNTKTLFSNIQTNYGQLTVSISSPVKIEDNKIIVC